MATAARRWTVVSTLVLAARGAHRGAGADRPRFGDHRRCQRRVQRRHPDRRKADADVPGAHPGLRPAGPRPSRRDCGQSEGARDRARAGCGAQDQRAALAAAWHSRRAEGQLRHRRHADHRRLGAARGLRAARRCVPGEETARGRRHHRRQGQPVRVCLRRRPQLARRADAESARPDAHAVGSSGGTGVAIAAAYAVVGWAPTPAVRFAGRRRRTASSASSRRMGCSAATASSRSR